MKPSISSFFVEVGVGDGGIVTSYISQVRYAVNPF
jgi:hypothetical protein